MLGWLERNQMTVLAAAVLVLAAGLAGTLVARDDSRPPIELLHGPSLPAGAPIRVHVTGAVVNPGVYDLREGDRVFEALAAAGGPSDDADPEAINLARRVHDEDQVVVPLRAGPAAAQALRPGAKVNINTAPAEALDAMLPGIGEAYARRIVDSRKVDGAYVSTEDLVARNVLPRAVYEKIRDLITVGE